MKIYLRTYQHLYLLINFILWAAFPVFSQLPSTSLYLFQYSLNGEKIRLSNPKMISNFTHDRYANQPNFIDRNEVLIASDDNGDGFTDLQKINLLTLEYSDVTNTDSISEFSPGLTPDRQFITCVRIEKDGKSQSLWKYPMNQSSYGSRLLTKLSDIGYYCWLSPDKIALYRVGEKSKLVIVDIPTESQQILAENIGRCLQMDDEGNLMYVHKMNADLWLLKRYSLFTKTTSIVSQITNEDFDILPGGTIISGNGQSELLFLDPESGESWALAEDLSVYGIHKITRITHKGNKIIIVNAIE